MNWTFEKPTRCGFYLHKHPTAVVLVSEMRGMTGLFVDQKTAVESAFFPGPWFGPIPDPPVRKEK